jgi:osmotically-inducible protein OsmY
MKTIQSNLQQNILDELKWEPSLDSSRIGVSVESGVVVLTGHVRSLVEKNIAEQAVKRVRGVSAVANELEIDILSGFVRDDVQIAKAAQLALLWNVMVPEERLKVTVSGGWVTLEGEVPFGYQRRAAQSAVEQLVGVRGVTNKITVRPGVSPLDLRRRLNAALHRYARLEAANIDTISEGSKVVLTGKVHSWAERDQVQDAAWSAPGVTEVDNRIAVAE